MKKSACQPSERASMNGGLLAGSRLKYDSTRGRGGGYNTLKSRQAACKINFVTIMLHNCLLHVNAKCCNNKFQLAGEKNIQILFT